MWLCTEICRKYSKEKNIIINLIYNFLYLKIIFNKNLQICNLISDSLLCIIFKKNNIYCSKFLFNDVSSLLKLN